MDKEETAAKRNSLMRTYALANIVNRVYAILGYPVAIALQATGTNVYVVARKG